MSSFKMGLFIYSYVPALKSLATEGLIQSGGTKTRVNIRSFGWVNSEFINNKGTSLEIKRKIKNILVGLLTNY